MDEPSPQLQPPGVTRLPNVLDSAAARVGRLPWWLIILVFGLAAALYGVITTPLYHRAFVYVTDDPQLSTSDFRSVTYSVSIDGQARKISGTVVAQSGDTITIRTVDPVSVIVSKSGSGTVKREVGTCPADAPNCTPPTTLTITTGAQTVKGIFYTETATDYRIQLDNGDIVSVKKLDVRATEQRVPAGCQPDIKGSCLITVIIPSTVVTGTLIAETPTDYTIQTVAPEYVTIHQADITNVISDYAGVCALNNLGSCQTGIFLTGFLAIISYALALVIGLVIALMRIASNPIFRNFATLYVEVVRGIPILVILLIFYFAVGPWVRDNLNIPMPDYVRGILGLAFAYGSFLAEIFRAGIQSISRGQMEAARSLGMTYFQAMRYVILPQAIRVVLPPLGNDFIAMLKDTSLVAFISLNEMTQLASLFNGRYYRPFEAFLTIAVLYLIMTLGLSFFVRVVEHRTRLPA